MAGLWVAGLMGCAVTGGVLDFGCVEQCGLAPFGEGLVLNRGCCGVNGVSSHELGVLFGQPRGGNEVDEVTVLDLAVEVGVVPVYVPVVVMTSFKSVL